jgi:hypothetical protein
MRLPRFTLRTLLVLVAACAGGIAFYRLMPNEVTPSQRARIVSGMNEKAVLAELGEPNEIVLFDGNVDWWYGYGWGNIVVRFKDDRVISVRWRGL